MASKRIPKHQPPSGTKRTPYVCLLTPELHEKLVADVTGKRVFDAQIAIRNGIHPDTLKNWLKWGLLPDAEEPYRAFAQDYANAQIDDECDGVRMVLDGTKPSEPGSKPGSWQAAAWYLERRYPRRWNPNSQPTTGPTEAIDIESLIRDATEQKTNLVELLKDPPPELVAAIREAASEIKALLAVDVQPAQSALTTTKPP